MGRLLAKLLANRDLLYMLTWRDIKLRYKQSVMGFFWAILMPSLIVGAGILVRFAFRLSSSQPLSNQDLASVCLKSLPWAFFASATKFATNSLVGNVNLVTKIYFPREIFPLAAVLASLFDAAVASVVVIAVLVLAKVGASVFLLWLPVLWLLLILLVAGLGMFLSCGNLFFRDVKYLVDVFLMFGILFTPVFYEAKMFGRWATILLLNPIGAILEAMNQVVILHRPPDYGWLVYAACWAGLGFLGAWKLFERSERAFAEMI